MSCRALFIGVALTVAACPLVAAEAPGGMVLLKDDSGVSWGPSPPSLPPGLQFAVLSGNPDKPGPFTLRIKAPAHFVIAPHTHAQPETVTVISGSFMHDMGNTLVRSRSKEVGAGGFVFLPANMPHTVWTADSPVEIQVNGTGPFGLHYINPKDDPRNNKS